MTRQQEAKSRHLATRLVMTSQTRLTLKHLNLTPLMVAAMFMMNEGGKCITTDDCDHKARLEKVEPWMMRRFVNLEIVYMTAYTPAGNGAFTLNDYGKEMLADFEAKCRPSVALWRQKYDFSRICLPVMTKRGW